ncbi:hypothetical protein GA0115239_10531, partial [Streptomyces sp. BpilaLS-43]|uniref:hypothetical protein n=1 Tax=Streptomyces sp. BpilaLS-43 TaxID=1839778 RepID=UPI00081B33EE
FGGPHRRSLRNRAPPATRGRGPFRRLPDDPGLYALLGATLALPAASRAHGLRSAPGALSGRSGAPSPSPRDHASFTTH